MMSPSPNIGGGRVPLSHMDRRPCIKPIWLHWSPFP